MKVSRWAHRTGCAAVFFAGLLLAGSAIAQDQYGAAASNEIEGLQLTARLDQSEGTAPGLPKFQVQLRNVGERNLLLNIGSIAFAGREQYATAISLILIAPGAKPQFLLFLRPAEDPEAKPRPLLLPLPVGASFSIPVDLANYHAIGSNTRFPELKAGSYLIAARFIGFNMAAAAANLPLVPSRLLPVTEQPFDTVGHTVGSSSAWLRFEVPRH